MDYKRVRRTIFAVLLAAVATLLVIRAWPDHAKPERASTPASAATSDVSKARPVQREPSALVAAAAHDAPTTAPQPAPQRSSLQLDVRVPTSVRTGETFAVPVALDVNVGAQQLEISMSYNRSLLRLVRFSSGALVQQAGDEARFGADEPSDGNIVISVDATNANPLIGHGNVAILEFQALKPGVSPLNVDSVHVVENGRTSDASVNPGQQSSISVSDAP